MTAKEAIGAEIKHRREELGYSRRRFSIAFGMTRQHIRNIETGSGNPTIETLQEYADALGTDVFDLVECASKRYRAQAADREGRSA